MEPDGRARRPVVDELFEDDEIDEQE